jgi:hypothetical protein
MVMSEARGFLKLAKKDPRVEEELIKGMQALHVRLVETLTMDGTSVAAGLSVPGELVATRTASTAGSTLVDNKIRLWDVQRPWIAVCF